jgi:hypothetical protein
MVFGPGGSVSDHASCSLPTFSLVISRNGEKPWPRCPRRHDSHSPGGGFDSMASVTGVMRASGFGRAGHSGIFTPGVGRMNPLARICCCPESAWPGTAMPARAEVSATSAAVPDVAPFSAISLASTAT